jgi:hypothetical protein
MSAQILVLMLVVSGAVEDEFAAIRAKVLEARAALQTGQARLVVEMTVGPATTAKLQANAPDANSPAPERTVYQLYYSGSQLRSDVLAGKVPCVDILNTKEHLHCLLEEQESKWGVLVNPRERGLQEVHDLRLMGIFVDPFGVSRNYRASDWLELSRLSDLRVERVREPGFDGELTLISASGRERQRDVRYWIDPQRGWNIVKG